MYHALEANRAHTVAVAGLAAPVSAMIAAAHAQRST
jgi:hypothetical protein